jgi:hypothetical protein
VREIEAVRRHPIVADVGAVVIELAIGHITALNRKATRFADLPDETAAGANLVVEDRVIQFSDARSPTKSSPTRSFRKHRARHKS